MSGTSLDVVKQKIIDLMKNKDEDTKLEKTLDELMREEWSFLNLQDYSASEEEEARFLQEFVKKLRGENNTRRDEESDEDLLKEFFTRSDSQKNKELEQFMKEQRNNAGGGDRNSGGGDGNSGGGDGDATGAAGDADTNNTMLSTTTILF